MFFPKHFVSSGCTYSLDMVHLGFQSLYIILSKESPTVSISMLYISEFFLSHPPQKSVSIGAGKFTGFPCVIKSPVIKFQRHFKHSAILNTYATIVEYSSRPFANQSPERTDLFRK
jgi:hypothetical protein